MTEKRKKLIWFTGISIAIILGVIITIASSTDHKFHIVKSGLFEQDIEVKGEIQGKNAIIINLPDELSNQDLRIYQLKIQDMVEEGTSVKKGDWVATLDAAQITQQMQNNGEDLEKRRAELNNAKIDSSIKLTKLREELGEFKYDLEYKKIELEQSKFESPAYQRKKKMQYDKTIRNMEKKHRDYQLKQLNLKLQTGRIEKRYDYYKKREELLKKALAATRVKAPKNGMVMYAKKWDGRKLQTGDQVSIWMPTIATLPDMSQPVSETYIPEIDITKIELGDSVDVTIDALPDKSFKGVVSMIANIGQEVPGHEMKVFTVNVDLFLNGEEIKPAMTSNNKIHIEHLPNSIKIPRPFLFSENGTSYVFIKKGSKILKKKVIPGLENEEEVIIKFGLAVNDKILTKIPDNADEIEYIE